MSPSAFRLPLPDVVGLLALDLVFWPDLRVDLSETPVLLHVIVCTCMTLYNTLCTCLFRSIVRAADVV